MKSALITSLWKFRYALPSTFGIVFIDSELAGGQSVEKANFRWLIYFAINVSLILYT